jgi:hypothetical protein
MLKKLTAIIFILASNYIFVPAALAQSLSEKLGAIETGFTMTSYGQDREVIEQFIIKRAEKIENEVTSSYYDTAYGLSLGYESLHMELVLEEEVERVQPENKKDRGNWELSLFDDQGNKIITVHIPGKQVKASGNPDDSLIYYNIDLQDVPLAPFNRANHLDLFYYH